MIVLERHQDVRGEAGEKALLYGCHQSRASWPLIASSLLIVAVGAWLTVSPLADTLGFVPLPPLYWALLGIMLPCYVVLTQLVKTWFYRKYGE